MYVHNYKGKRTNLVLARKNRPSHATIPNTLEFGLIA